MIKALELTNFRKHRKLELQFTAGLQVIRGVNESGKTTISESIGYALFGSKCLRESLPDVVTYGEPESSLKVKLELTFDGVDYTVTRGKSGAEIIYGDQRVTGQNETRAFFERLFNCTVDIAKALIIADQNEVRGVLAEGSAAASSLVEKLADLGVIEKLVEGVQSHLPSGNVKSLEAQIEEAEREAEIAPKEPEEPDTLELEIEIFDLRTETEQIEEMLPTAQQLKSAKAKVLHKLKVAAELESFYERQEFILQELENPLRQPSRLSAVEQSFVDMGGKNIASMRKAYETRFPTSELLWEGTLASLKEEIDYTKSKTQSWLNTLKSSEQKIAVLQSQKILADTCPTCKQSLPNEEHRHKANEDIEKEIKEETIKSEEAKDQLNKCQENLGNLQSVLDTHMQVVSLASPWHMLTSDVPAKANWSGPVPPDTEELLSIVKKVEAIKQYSLDVQRRKALEEELNKELPELPDTAYEEEMIDTYDEKVDKMHTKEKELANKESRLAAKKSEYAALSAAYKKDLDRFTRAKERVSSLNKLKSEMLENNELIKKLRAARPEIATKVWGLVLGAISHYFSQIRGVESVLTRDADGFKVNGKSVKGLSGSTQDALGLAIRMALSKVFLPVVPFVFLDESFAACDDERELNGLGTLASAGFTQTFLVTHSDLGDSLADNLLAL